MISDIDLIRVLEGTYTIAIVGASNNPTRASYQVLMELNERGYQIFAVNPALEDNKIGSVPRYRSLREIDQPIDMVDIFRNSEAAADVVDDILELPVLPKTIWMQLGVINEIAAEKARAKGIDVVMDRCPKIELLRLGLKGPKSRV